MKKKTLPLLPPKGLPVPESLWPELDEFDRQIAAARALFEVAQTQKETLLRGFMAAQPVTPGAAWEYRADGRLVLIREA